MILARFESFGAIGSELGGVVQVQRGWREQVDLPETRVWTVGKGTLESPGQTSCTPAKRQFRITMVLTWTVGLNQFIFNYLTAAASSSHLRLDSNLHLI